MKRSTRPACASSSTIVSTTVSTVSSSAAPTANACLCTQAQRDRAIQIALDECSGRVPVIAGCMDSSTQRVIENVQRLEEMGGTTAVVTPVFYARHATQGETVRHFEEISKKNTNANLMIYNIPPFTGQNLTADTIIKISKIDKVIGVKDTSGNFPNFIKLLNYFKSSDFLVHQGATNLAVPSMLMGADGSFPPWRRCSPRPTSSCTSTARQATLRTP